MNEEADDLQWCYDIVFPMAFTKGTREHWTGSSDHVDFSKGIIKIVERPGGPAVVKLRDSGVTMCPDFHLTYLSDAEFSLLGKHFS